MSTVTVAIPAYNARDHVAAAIESVLAQTHPHLELFVVDDGSTDDTAAVAERYTSDARVQVLRQPNSGVARARNRGIRAGTGPYVALLDADDTWAATKLERQLQEFQRDPELGAVGTFMHHVAPSGRVLGVSGHRIGPKDRARLRQARLMPFPVSSLVVRRAVVDEVGLFDEALQAHCPGLIEDIDLVSRIAAVAEVGCVPEPLGTYLMHTSGASARHFRSQRQGLRYLQARIEARERGEELGFSEFEARQGFSLQRWRQDTGAFGYRSAGVAVAEGRWWRAAWWALVAAGLTPARTVRRLRRQRGELRR